MNVTTYQCRLALEMHIRDIVRANPIKHNDGKYEYVFKPKFDHHVAHSRRLVKRKRGEFDGEYEDHYRVGKVDHGTHVVYELLNYVIEHRYDVYQNTARLPSETHFCLYGATTVYPLVVRGKKNHTKHMISLSRLVGYVHEYYEPSRKSHILDVCDPESFNQTTQFVHDMVDKVKRYFI